jgi:hypothetical protein
VRRVAVSRDCRHRGATEAVSKFVHALVGQAEVLERDQRVGIRTASAWSYLPMVEPVSELLCLRARIEM